MTSLTDKDRLYRQQVGKVPTGQGDIMGKSFDAKPRPSDGHACNSDKRGQAVHENPDGTGRITGYERECSTCGTYKGVENV